MRSERPGLEPGYGVANSDEGIIPWQESQERLVASRNYWIGTADLEGDPHSVPVWGVWMDNCLFFGTDQNSKKAANLEANPRAVVHLESGDEVVIIHCSIATVGDAATIDRILGGYRAKYSMPADFTFAPVYTARPTKGFAWVEADFPNTATRYTP